MNKKWYMSKTVWGAGVALLIAISSAAFGESNTLTQVAIAIASALGLYGRVNANSKLTL